jgi:hypothetical protein
MYYVHLSTNEADKCLFLCVNQTEPSYSVEPMFAWALEDGSDFDNKAKAKISSANPSDWNRSALIVADDHKTAMSHKHLFSRAFAAQGYEVLNEYITAELARKPPHMLIYQLVTSFDSKGQRTIVESYSFKRPRPKAKLQVYRIQANEYSVEIVANPHQDIGYLLTETKQLLLGALTAEHPILSPALLFIGAVKSTLHQQSDAFLGFDLELSIDDLEPEKYKVFLKTDALDPMQYGGPGRYRLRDSKADTTIIEDVEDFLEPYEDEGLYCLVENPDHHLLAFNQGGTALEMEFKLTFGDRVQSGWKVWDDE